LFGVVIVFDQPAQGYTVSGSTYNTNGSSSDVQAAINAAPNGATIRIPAGNFTKRSRTTGGEYEIVVINLVVANAPGRSLLAVTANG
jgi:hypothetical protein